MRVLHIQKASGIGGSERHLLTLLPALAAEGIDVRMAILAAGDWERFAVPLREAGIDTVTLPAGRDLAPGLVPALAREIRRFRPELVHTHLIHADLYGQVAARLSGVPGVSSVHSTDPLYRRQPSRTAAKLAGRLARRTIAISEHVAGYLRAHHVVPPDRVRVVRYGIDAAAWRVTRAERAAARERFGVLPADIVIGMAARMIRGKGHERLLAAAEQLLDTPHEIRYLLAGDGPLRSELERRAARLPRGLVTFTGFIDDVRSFWAACDAACFLTEPWLGEGFGLAALEAMAAGVPVLATKVASIPEIVVDRGTGWLFSPRGAAEVAIELAAFLVDPSREDMGAAAAERAASGFTVERMVRGTLDVYLEALAKADR